MIAICHLDDIPKLGARRYQREDGTTIALFRIADDRVFALRDACPHKGGPLSQGIVFGQSVACPLHNWCIDLASGSAAAPDEGHVERFAISVLDGVVRIGESLGPAGGAATCEAPCSLASSTPEASGAAR